MTDFNKNYFSENDREKNGENERQKTVPEYSFWAEQLSDNTYSNYNPETNSWEYFNHKETKEIPVKGKEPGKIKILKLILGALIFGMLAGGSFLGVQQLYYVINPSAQRNAENWGYNFGSSEEYNYSPSSQRAQSIGSTEPASVKRTDRGIISEVVDHMMPATVSIRSISTQSNSWFGRQIDQDVEGSGSGIIVGKNEEELLIATNNHVVAGTNRITVTFIDGKEAEAVIKGTDATADLAVITVDLSTLDKETLGVIEVARLGNSDQIKVGEMAVAIGNALGYGQSVTVGYISAKDRKVEVSDGFSYKTMVFLQTDAAINPGNSGGALLNIKGEVIGINTVKYASSSIEGMGYAIPISRALPIINELMSREILKANEKGFLGVAPTDVTEEISVMYNIPIGVFLSEVFENSAAAKGGLMQGDIIIAVSEVEITSSSQLREKVSSIRAGTEIEVKYMRNIDGQYKELTAKVVLGARPEE